MDLFSAKEKEIINLLITDDKTLSEISEHLGISKPATSKYLKKFTQQKIIRGTYEKTNKGRTIRYHLLPFHLICSIDPETKTIIYVQANQTIDDRFPYLGMIPQKRFRQEVSQYLTALPFLHANHLLIILFGSIAQGNGQRKSDIDLLLIKETWSQKDQDLIYESFAEASIRCKHQISPLFKTTKEFKAMDEEFKKELYTHGIILFSSGRTWQKIVQNMKRYKSISTSV